MKYHSYLLIPIIFLIILSSCNVLPNRAPPLKRHDFGPLPQVRQQDIATATINFLFEGVRAPTWLDTTEIRYRLLYQDPTRLRAYAYHQWIASPVALIEHRLREWLIKFSQEEKLGSTAVPSHQLNLELNTFEQIFDSPNTARAVIRLRAVLIPTNQAGSVVEQDFIVQRQCPPHVQGAITTLAALVDTILQDILQWAGPQNKPH